MFNYSLKTKIIIILVFLGLVAGIVTLLAFNFSRARDINLVAEARILATAMERYYDKYQTYPLVQKTTIANIRVLSDQGFNQDGELVYWRRGNDILDPATLASDGTNYAISFELSRSWPAWGITSFDGGLCRVTTNAILQCASN